jgi:hypothetical protein
MEVRGKPDPRATEYEVGVNVKLSSFVSIVEPSMN